MPTDKVNFSSSKDSATTSSFFDDNAQVIHRKNFSLTYTGAPVWLVNGSVLHPRTPEAFEQITQLYIQDQIKFLHSLRGHFALQLVNTKTNSHLVASDRIGVHRLYWCKNSGQKPLVSTSVSKLRAAQNTTSQFSPTALYCYMYFHMVPTPFSIYPDIEKLPPAHCLKYENGNIHIEPYWVPQFTEACEQNIESLSDTLHRTLEKSVKSCIGDETDYATFLSGGLDSSTVTGVASKLDAGSVK